MTKDDKTREEGTFNKSSFSIGALSAVGLLALALVAGNASCGNANTPKKTVTTTNIAKPAKNAEAQKPVPPVLAETGELGENIYDAAKADDWKKVDEKLKTLTESAKTLAAERIQPADLDSTVKSLQDAVNKKDKKETLLESNRITLEISNKMSGFSAKVPPAVAKLDYLGREIEIWSSDKNQDRLKETVKSLRSTWDGVKPKIEAAGGTTQAKEFESLVQQAEMARSPEEYGKLATPILDKVDELEKVFTAA